VAPIVCFVGAGVESVDCSGSDCRDVGESVWVGG